MGLVEFLQVMQIVLIIALIILLAARLPKI